MYMTTCDIDGFAPEFIGALVAPRLLSHRFVGADNAVRRRGARRRRAGRAGRRAERVS